jgi:hypothetical protein
MSPANSADFPGLPASHMIPIRTYSQILKSLNPSNLQIPKPLNSQPMKHHTLPAPAAIVSAYPHAMHPAGAGGGDGAAPSSPALAALALVFIIRRVREE